MFYTDITRSISSRSNKYLANLIRQEKESIPSLCSNRGDRRFLQYETPRPLIRGCCLYINSTPYLFKEDPIAKCTFCCAGRNGKLLQSVRIHKLFSNAKCVEQRLIKPPHLHLTIVNYPSQIKISFPLLPAHLRCDVASRLMN
jgi:hypothetical protein